jgi:hypothetical protein
VCGNACVPDSTCCTNGQPGRCPDCSTCMGNGQCSAPNGISCGNGRCVNPARGECCQACPTGDPCRACTADGQRCAARPNQTCMNGEGRCNANGGCDPVKVPNLGQCTRGNAQCESNNCSMNVCCPQNQRKCRNKNACEPPGNRSCGPDCKICPNPVNGGGTGVCRGDDCALDCDGPLRPDRTGTRCIQCEQNGDCNDPAVPVCENNRCVRETQFRFLIDGDSVEYGFNCTSQCPGSVPQDRSNIFNGCPTNAASCSVNFPSLNGDPTDPCPGCRKFFRWSWFCIGMRSGARTRKSDSITSHDPGDTALNGNTAIRITCP